MSTAFIVIVFLIATTPILAFGGGFAASALQALVVAVGLAAIAIAARGPDVIQFKRARSGLTLIALLVPLWIVVQLLPLPRALSHPIWTSTNEALQSSSSGHISVDIGRTLAALFSTLTLLALVGLTIVVARVRRRAELILFVASATTTLLALAALTQTIWPTLSRGPSSIAIDLVNISSLGIVLNLAVILLAIERRETRREAASGAIQIGLAGLAGTAICGGALFATASAAGGIAAALGITVFLLIFITRRLDLGRWPTLALAMVAIAGGGLMIAWLFEGNPDTPLLLRLLPPAPTEPIAAMGRMLADARWSGSGAGTFQTLARIYRGSEGAELQLAPSAAVQLFVELGWIGLIGVIAIGSAVAVKLFRGALQRGRDSFFPAAAAACVTICLCEGFGDPGPLQPAIATIMATIVGLGLSQGVSQSTQH